MLSSWLIYALVNQFKHRQGIMERRNHDSVPPNRLP
jgi:hypothetical protein